MSRYRAASLHFLISLAIFVALAWVIVELWYPGFFFESDGGWEGIRIIVLVDLVLGPTLTLVVFKSGKPGLRFDLGVIALLQAAALAAGTWVVHDQRPLAMVYVDGQFFSLSRDDFTDAKVALPDFAALPGAYPKWVTVDLPDDPIAQSDLRSQMLRSKTPLRLLTRRYVPFAANERFLSEAYDAADLEKRDETSRRIGPWLARHGGTLADYRFYLFGARYKYVFLAYRVDARRFAGLLDVSAPFAPSAPG